MKVDGSCHCGSIKFTAEVDSQRVVVCHCTDCQALSGSAFRATVPAKVESFELQGDPPTIYLKVAESGDKRVQAFCATCGSSIYSSQELSPTHVFVRLGVIRQRAALRPSVQIWNRSAQGWISELKNVPSSSEQQALVAK